jgi:hypothetical protein
MKMIECAKRPAFDVVLFARPDVQYLDPLSAREELLKISSGEFDMLTPVWERWGGLNDRICMCNMKAAKVYASRLLMLEHVIDRGVAMNSERILSYACEINRVNNGDLAIRGVRVRAFNHFHYR